MHHYVGFHKLGHIWNDMDLSSLYETTCTLYGNMIVCKIQLITNITASGTKFFLRVTDYGNLSKCCQLGWLPYPFLFTALIFHKSAVWAEIHNYIFKKLTKLLPIRH